MDDKYLWIIIGAVIAIIVARIEHNLRRRRERLCDCGSSTHRVYQMVRTDPKQSAKKKYGEYYSPFTFDVCDSHVCGKTIFIKSDDKWFSKIEIWWRRLTDSSQFRIDPTLFQRAGLTGDSMPCYIKMMLGQMSIDRRANRMSATLKN